MRHPTGRRLSGFRVVMRVDGVCEHAPYGEGDVWRSGLSVARLAWPRHTRSVSASTSGSCARSSAPARAAATRPRKMDRWRCA